MSYKSKQSGLNRTNFSTKSDKQAKNILAKHYAELDKPVPKYIREGKLTPSKIARAKKSLNNYYSKAVSKETAIKKDYKAAVKAYNKNIEKYNNQILDGRGSLERQFLSGESIKITAITNRPFSGTKFTLQKIEKEMFNGLEGMQRRTEMIKNMTKNTFGQGVPSDSQLYKTDYNAEVFGKALDHTRMFLGSQSTDRIEILKEKWGGLTEFQKELAMAAGLEEVIAKYFNDDVELSEEDLNSFEKHLNNIIDGIVDATQTDYIEYIQAQTIRQNVQAHKEERKRLSNLADQYDFNDDDISDIMVEERRGIRRAMREEKHKKMAEKNPLNKNKKPTTSPTPGINPFRF